MTTRRRGAQAFIILLGAIGAIALIASEVARTREVRRRLLDAAQASLTADTCAFQSRLADVHLLLLLASHDPDVSRFGGRARDRLQDLLESSRAAAALARLYVVRRTFDGRKPFLELRAKDAPGPATVAPPADGDAEVYGTLLEQLATFADHPRLSALPSLEIDIRATRPGAKPGQAAPIEWAVVFAVPIRSPDGDLTGAAAAAIPNDRIRAVISAMDDRDATLFLRPGLERLAAGDVSPARARWLAGQVPPDRVSRSEQLRALPDALGPAVSIWRPITVAGVEAGWVARIIDPGRGGWLAGPGPGLLGGGSIFALAVSLALMMRRAGRPRDTRAKVDAAPAHVDKPEAVPVLARDLVHDINNILATILTIGRWLESQIGPNDPSIESVREIVAAARRGGTLTRGLLGGRDPDQERASPIPAASQEAALLIIDDEAPLRGVVRAAFEQSGFRVLEAGDGEEALATFDARAGAIDCVLLDVELPTIGGRECLERLRERSPSLPVVMVTGQVLGDAAEALVAAGAHAVLAKPVEVEELLAVVREALQLARRTPRKER